MMNSKFLKNKVLFSLVVFSFILTVLPVHTWAAPSPVKNVIIIMTDGTGSAHTTLSRWYNGGQPLAVDEIVAGLTRTHSAESVITDSAPQSVAIATGHKSNSKFIGVLPAKTTIPGVAQIPDELKYKPVANLSEGAKLMGKSVGIIATSNLQHAHPAGFSAHWPDRNNYNEIAEQQAYQNIDLFLGGGKQAMLPKELGGSRIDGENLIDVVKSRGYTVIETREELQKVTRPKVWGVFADDAMAYDFDRNTLRPTEPSLPEMTQKAIELLSQNQKGFFLFIEASKVDWASHANDPIGVISDTLAWDKAVKVALDFAKKDGKTLVMAFADHGNGGLSIGNKSTDKNYDTLSYEALITPLKKALLTGEGIEKMLGSDLSENNIRAVMNRYYGVEDLSKEEVQAIQKAKPGNFNYVVGPILSKRTALGWTTNGHTGEDLTLYAYGPNHPTGLIDNTEVAKIAAKSLGFDLADIDNKLFVEATKAFATIGATARIDDTDKTNMVLVVEKGTKRAELPFNKNIIKIGTKTYEMNGITVYAPKTGKVYIPQQAVELAKAAGL